MERQREEAEMQAAFEATKARTSTFSSTAGAPADPSYAPASLGYGSTHRDHFVYTRNADRKGVNTPIPSHQMSLTLGSEAVAPAGASAGAPFATSTAGAAWLDRNATSADFARSKTRFADPASLAAPQSIGYGRRHQHYFNYVAPVLEPVDAKNGAQ
jgi:hypothetical protein